MKIQRVHKDSVDIELEGEYYRIFGVLADRFYASPKDIRYIRTEKHPISMEDRQRLADSFAGYGTDVPDRFIRFLRDKDIPIETCLETIPDNEIPELVHRISEEWDKACPKFELRFILQTFPL